jgi:hypothetical protein
MSSATTVSRSAQVASRTRAGSNRGALGGIRVFEEIGWGSLARQPGDVKAVLICNNCRTALATTFASQES